MNCHPMVASSDIACSSPHKTLYAIDLRTWPVHCPKVTRDEKGCLLGRYAAKSVKLRVMTGAEKNSKTAHMK